MARLQSLHEELRDAVAVKVCQHQNCVTTHTHSQHTHINAYILLLLIQFTHYQSLVKSTQLHEYGLTMAELGFDPAARSLNKTKRLLALTGASDSGPGPARYSETA